MNAIARHSGIAVLLAAISGCSALSDTPVRHVSAPVSNTLESVATASGKLLTLPPPPAPPRPPAVEAPATFNADSNPTLGSTAPQDVYDDSAFDQVDQGTPPLAAVDIIPVPDSPIHTTATHSGAQSDEDSESQVFALPDNDIIQQR